MTDETTRPLKVKAALPALVLPAAHKRKRCARCHSINYFQGMRCTLCGSYFNVTRRWVAMIMAYIVLLFVFDPNRSWMRQRFSRVVLPWSQHLGPITAIAHGVLVLLFGHYYIASPYELISTELAVMILVIQKCHGLVEMILKRLATIVVRIVRVGGANAKYRGWAMMWSMVGFTSVVMLTLLDIGPIAKLQLTHHPSAFRWTVTLVVAVLVARIHPLRLLAELEWAIVKPLRFYLVGLGWLGFRELVSPRREKEDTYGPSLGYRCKNHVDREKKQIPADGANVFVLRQRVPQKATTAS